MNNVGQREIMTQQHVIDFFREVLGYDYLGRWQDREGNANIEVKRLTAWLQRQGHDEKIISRALFAWRSSATSTQVHPAFHKACDLACNNAYL